jgi:hypothetical protein
MKIPYMRQLPELQNVVAGKAGAASLPKNAELLLPHPVKWLKHFALAVRDALRKEEVASWGPCIAKALLM